MHLDRHHLAWFLLPLLLLASVAAGAVGDDAYAAKVAGDYPRAIELYRQLCEQEPEDVEYAYQLGTVLGWAGQREEALRVLRQGLARAPEHLDLRLAEGRVLAWSGLLEEAETKVREIVTAFPTNRDALNLLGRILMWRRQFDAADEVFQRLLRIAPDDPDALIGAGDVQKFQERFDEARPYYERAQRADPASTEIRRRLDDLKRAGRWRLTAGCSISTYSGGSTQSNWFGVDAALRYAINKRTGVSVFGEWARRFGLADARYGLGLDRRFNDRLSGTASASVAPAARFFARRRLDLGAEWVAGKGGKRLPPTVLLADYRTSQYSAGTARTFALGVTQYLPRQFALTYKRSFTAHPNGRHTQGWQIRIDRDSTARWHWNLGYAESWESLSATLYDYLRDVRNRAVFGSVYHEFSATFGLRLDVSREWSPGSPARTTFHGGILTRF